MDIYRKLLILAIIIIFSFIIYKLLIRRNEILYQTKRDGFSSINISSIKIDNLTKKNGITDPYNAMILKQFVIKSSYNSAYDGKDISGVNVINVLKRGYRFLDFCINNNDVVYSEDGISATSTSQIPFTTLLINYIIPTAFSSDVPNSKDPLFIQLRYLSKTISIDFSQDKDKDMISIFYQKMLTQNTKIDDIMGKIVFLYSSSIQDFQIKIDNTNIVSYNNDNNIIKTLPSLEITNKKKEMPLILKDNFTTNISMITQVLPLNATANNDTLPLIQYYGGQITPMLAWVDDTYLANYEEMFNNSNSGIIPLSTALSYVKKNDNTKLKNSYPTAFGGNANNIK